MNKNIIEFLIRAKKATYAGKGAEVAPSRPNSHDFEYVEGELKYIDTYLGGEQFAGEEALWENDIPFWSMNYMGRLLNNGELGDFLKEALMQVSDDMPYRGPVEYTDGDYLYKCTVEGSFTWFTGYEEIFNKDTKIYECVFHGGSIK